MLNNKRVSRPTPGMGSRPLRRGKYVFGSDRLTRLYQPSDHIWDYQELSNMFGRYRELQREKVWSRIHLVPLLLAEGDRDAYRREQAAIAREREIMKNVKGWEVSFCWPHSTVSVEETKIKPRRDEVYI